MTIELFLILLTTLSIVTSLCTEAVKKFLDSLNFKYASNIVVLCVSIIVGGLGTAVFYLWNNYAWTTLNNYRKSIEGDFVIDIGKLRFRESTGLRWPKK